MKLALGREVFAILTALVEERTGLHYDLEDRELFADKVGTRAIEAGFDSALDYYYHLRYDDTSGAEFEALVESLVVGETYFFREADALRTLIACHIQPLVEAGRRPRLWTAASSTGEEPLTIAMMLDDAGLLSKVEIVATDISARSLARAREGAFGRRSLRALPAGVAGRWLTLDASGDRATVDPRLVAAIDWRRANLVDTQMVDALGKFDAIVCRNVLIYFRDATVTKVVNLLGSALRDDGWLIVGASESLLRFGTLLECEERQGTFYYRRGGPTK